MAARNYGEYCGLTRALELVGERWGLLVIRELLPGPKRFTDLARVCRGFPSNVLSGRLKEMEQAGIVERRVLPRPSSAVVYELTDYGARARRDRPRARTLGHALGRRAARGRQRQPGRARARACGRTSGPKRRTSVRATYELRLGEIVVQRARRRRRPDGRRRAGGRARPDDPRRPLAARRADGRHVGHDPARRRRGAVRALRRGCSEQIPSSTVSDAV